jgi:hypothetical protein
METVKWFLNLIAVILVIVAITVFLSTKFSRFKTIAKSAIEVYYNKCPAKICPEKKLSILTPAGFMNAISKYKYSVLKKNYLDYSKKSDIAPPYVFLKICGRSLQNYQGGCQRLMNLMLKHDEDFKVKSPTELPFAHAVVELCKLPFAKMVTEASLDYEARTIMEINGVEYQVNAVERAEKLARALGNGNIEKPNCGSGTMRSIFQLLSKKAYHY